MLAVIDARRGEAFAAGWRDGEPVLEPVALPPAALAERVAGEGGPWLAVGDGALRFRADLEGAGCTVHRTDPRSTASAPGRSARSRCRHRRPLARDLVVPDYLRLPDAVLAATSPPR